MARTTRMMARMMYHGSLSLAVEVAEEEEVAETVTSAERQTPKPETTVHPSFVATHEPLCSVVVELQLRQWSDPAPEHVPHSLEQATQAPFEVS